MALNLRKEALRLYRDILRATRPFSWPDQHGIPWRAQLNRSARKEFEDARFETDPEILLRLLVQGREFLMNAQQQMLDKQEKLLKEQEDEDQRRSRK